MYVRSLYRRPSEPYESTHRRRRRENNNFIHDLELVLSRELNDKTGDRVRFILISGGEYFVHFFSRSGMTGFQIGCFKYLTLT